jgi:hypothetical protein
VKRTRRPPTGIHSIREDTRHEQFFFDDPTIERLVGLLDASDDPLLVCLPSVAVALADRGRPARLLDRDRRFHGLPRARDFDLHQPDFIEGRHDFLLCDPPFANVTLSTLRTTLDLLVASAMTPTSAPCLGLAYISSREPQLLRAFSDYDLRPIGPPLGYRSVARATQDRIRLYLSTGARTACGLP